MSLINISNLTFCYDGSYNNVFTDVSFQIDTDWKLGLTGRNGKGKTTFLNLLLGRYEYVGKISSAVNFEYFPYDIKDKSITTAEVVESICPDFLQWELVRELHLLDVKDDVLYRSFETLSNGEQTKVLIAALFLKENSFLLIDEPTNHLDMQGRKIVSNYLNSKKGFILVSHDRAFLDGCIDHILSINKENIEIQRGDFSSWFINKERQDNFNLAENEKLQKEVKRLKKAAVQTSDWSDKTEKTKYGVRNSGLRPDKGYIGHKSAKMMKRSKCIEDRRQTAIEEKSGLLKNIENTDFLKISQLKFHTSCLVYFNDVSIFYGEQSVCKNITFAVEDGDRIALCGKNGSGKSSIIKLISGEDIKHTGDFKKGSHLKISLVSQDASVLSGSLSEYAAQKGIDESLFKAVLKKLDFSRVQFEHDMSNFSGGQKKKVLLAGSLCEKSHLHIWDEPLNFIDLISRIQIEELLIKFKPTLLFVEHDSIFCNKIATKWVSI